MACEIEPVGELCVDSSAAIRIEVINGFKITFNNYTGRPIGVEKIPVLIEGAYGDPRVDPVYGDSSKNGAY